MEQIQYRGAAQSVPFAPLRAADRTDAMRARLQQDLEWMREDNSLTIQNRNSQADAMARQNQLNQSFRIADLENLSEFSATLTKAVAERQERKGKEEEAEGESLAYQEGLQLEEVAAFKAGVAKLDEADRVASDLSVEAARAGQPFEIQEKIRNLSGRRAFGYARGKARLAGLAYGGWLEQKFSTDNETQITVGGETFTPMEAQSRGSAAVQAAAAVLRSQFMAQTGLLGTSHALLNEYAWPLMHQADAKVVGSIAAGYKKERQDESQLQAFSDLATEAESDPNIVNTTIRILMRDGGMAGADARTKVFEQLKSMLYNGKVSKTSYDAILATPSDVDGKTPIGELFAPQLLEVDARMQDIQSRENEKARAQQESQEREFNDALVKEMEKGTYSNEQIDRYITKSRQEFGRVDPRILDYRQNRTLQARSSADQSKAVQELWNLNRLTVAGLRSGAYNDDVVKEWLPEAEQQDAQRAPAVTKQKELSQQAIKDELANKIGRINANEAKNASYSFALGRAYRHLDTLAASMIAGGKNATEAYEAAGRIITAEIVSATEKSSSPYRVNGRKGGDAQFTAFAGVGDAKAQYDQAKRRIATISQRVRSGGAAIVRQEPLLELEEAKGLVDPTSPIPDIVTTIAASTNGKMGVFDVIDAQLSLYKLPKRQRPMPQKYVESKLTPEMLRLLEWKPTAPQTQRALISSGDVPLAPRRGPDGFRDMVLIATKLGHPNPAVAAAQWALESGYGSKQSGKNNLFGQKGAGSSVRTTEYIGGRQVSVQDSFVDYPTVHDSVKDHVKLWGKYAAGATPAEGIANIIANGYATDPNYISKVRKILKDNGINPDQPYQPYTGPTWHNPALISAAARKVLSQTPFTSGFGMRNGKPHEGNDRAVPVGTKISLPKPATVVVAQDDGTGYGKWVEVEYADGTRKTFAHLSEYYVKPGDKIGPKQVFAKSGNTGTSSGPHIHFEVRKGGIAIDPSAYEKDVYVD